LNFVSYDVKGAEVMKYLVLPMLLFQTGCTVLTIADAGVSVVATTVKVGAKVVGAAVDAVLPNTEKDKK
jgi:hypothetical protein